MIFHTLGSQNHMLECLKQTGHFTLMHKNLSNMPRHLHNVQLYLLYAATIQDMHCIEALWCFDCAHTFCTKTETILHSSIA